MGSLWINAGPVFSVAKSAAYRMTTPHPDPEGSGNEALIAIVFAAAALETFINEAAGLAEQSITSKDLVREQASVEKFAKKWAKIERKRWSTSSKFQAASKAFSGKPYAEDQPPYVDAALLMDVRNGIMHGKDEDPTLCIDLTTEPPELARRLTQRG